MAGPTKEDGLQQQGPTIARASATDVHAIDGLARSLARESSAGEKRNNGFIKPYSVSEYQHFVKCADYFFAAYAGTRLVGFVLAHSSEKTSEFGGEVYEHINDALQGSYIVVRQICIAPAYSGKGYGRMLYRHVFEMAKNAGRKYDGAVCFIWKVPRNRESERFHSAMGWTEVETYGLRDGSGTVGIWRVDLG